MRPTSDSGGKRAAGRYVLGDLLGRGGMAEVFAGNSVGDHGFQKPVAIKRLLPELANDEVFVERLIGEAKLTVGMQHGNIVSVLDLAREGDDVFLVMEFVDGPSLRQLIKSRGTRGLSHGTVTFVIQSAAQGLEFAHSRPGGAVIHADVSPSNILLTTSGEVRVADFGIARRENTGEGVVEGKWAYMAPEQARGEKLSPRADVFALGVCLYELLTGQHPFGKTVTAEERESERMRVVPPRMVKASVPPGLDAICMRALAHDPRDRYPRMQSMIDALVEERFANGYREGAADLAMAIREVLPRAEVGNPRTMVTDRPVTIMTRSLLRDATPVRRPAGNGGERPSGPSGHGSHGGSSPSMHGGHGGSSPSMHGGHGGSSPSMHGSHGGHSVHAQSVHAGHPQSAHGPSSHSYSQSGRAGSQSEHGPAEGEPFVGGDAAPVMDSGARTMMHDVDQVALAAAAAMLEIPPGLRADGTPMPPFRAPTVPAHALAGTHGGSTANGEQVAVEAPVRSHRWTIGVLGAAALAGMIAALAFQLSRGDAGAAPPPSTTPAAKPSFADDLSKTAPSLAPPLDPSGANPSGANPSGTAGSPSSTTANGTTNPSGTAATGTANPPDTAANGTANPSGTAANGAANPSGPVNNGANTAATGGANPSGTVESPSGTGDSPSGAATGGANPSGTATGGANPSGTGVNGTANPAAGTVGNPATGTANTVANGANTAGGTANPSGANGTVNPSGAANGTAANGTAANGTAANGTAANGTAANGRPNTAANGANTSGTGANGGANPSGTGANGTVANPTAGTANPSGTVNSPSATVANPSGTGANGATSPVAGAANPSGTGEPSAGTAVASHEKTGAHGGGTKPAWHSRTAPVAAAKKDPGFLRFGSDPYANVYIGSQHGDTTMKFTLAPGTYNVRLVTESGHTKVLSVTISSGQTKIVAGLDWGGE